jgi:nucleotidyltransferase substrate binding protein (TIGR01987 family)
MDTIQSLEAASANSPRWHERLEQFCKALATLEEVVPRASELNELEKDGLLQRFEFTFELAWKLMQDYAYHIGQTHIKGPRPVLAEMSQNGLIDAFLWNEMLTTRNKLTHLYDEQASRQFVRTIATIYIGVFQDFRQAMTRIQEANA